MHFSIKTALVHKGRFPVQHYTVCQIPDYNERHPKIASIIFPDALQMAHNVNLNIKDELKDGNILYVVRYSRVPGCTFMMIYAITAHSRV